MPMVLAGCRHSLSHDIRFHDYRQKDSRRLEQAPAAGSSGQAVLPLGSQELRCADSLCRYPATTLCRFAVQEHHTCIVQDLSAGYIYPLSLLPPPSTPSLP
jgi:hypothetical protein